MEEMGVKVVVCMAVKLIKERMAEENSEGQHG